MHWAIDIWYFLKANSQPQGLKLKRKKYLLPPSLTQWRDNLAHEDSTPGRRCVPGLDRNVSCHQCVCPTPPRCPSHHHWPQDAGFGWTSGHMLVYAANKLQCLLPDIYQTWILVYHTQCATFPIDRGPDLGKNWVGQGKLSNLVARRSMLISCILLYDSITGLLVYTVGLWRIIFRPVVYDFCKHYFAHCTLVTKLNELESRALVDKGFCVSTCLASNVMTCWYVFPGLGSIQFRNWNWNWNWWN